MKNALDLRLLSHVLPAGLLGSYDLIGVKEVSSEGSSVVSLEMSLDEKNELPEGYSSSDYESKGFYDTVRIQDFALRGRAVYLLIRRRRWRHKQSGAQIQSDHTFIAEGSKLTSELSAFLKGTH